MNGVKKVYYSISEVSGITHLEQYVLRYWESEFEQLRPAKNRAGNRVYTEKDIRLILQIKRLLRDDRYTIEGTKQVLRTGQLKEIVSFPIESRVVIRKLYYSISEVSKITDLEQYVLRYWESEFEQLQPAKNRAGNRIYTNRDIKLILHVKNLLRQERYTIERVK
jgi:DNA-binding transcriptional MerR regulator